MADVIVNIRGNASDLQNTLDNVSGGASNQLPPRGGAQQPPITPNGGSTTQPQPSTTPTGGDMPAMPTYERMSQDIRREILSRGVVMVPGSSNYNQMMNAITNSQRDKANAALDAKYDEKYYILNQQRETERKNAADEIEKKRQAALSTKTDPLEIASINRNFDSVLNKRLSRIDSKFEPQFDRLGEEANAERAKVDKDLTRIIQELTEELKRGNPDSYLNRLREQKQQAVYRRENATTEEDVQAASRDVAAIDKRIARAMGTANPIQRFGSVWGTGVGMAKIGVDAINAYRANTRMEIDEVNAMANGNAFAAMEQDLNRRRMNSTAWGSAIGGVLGGIVGGVGAALGSWGIGAGAGAAGGALVGGGAGSWAGSAIFDLMHGSEVNQVKLGSLWADQEKRLQNYTQLAMMIRGDRNISQVRQELLGYSDMNAMALETFDTYKGKNLRGLGGVGLDNGLSIYDLGYTQDQASKVIAQRLAQRGFYTSPESAYANALTADALEKVFNMSSGSLGQLSAYDRYGNNANQTMSNIVASLSARGTIGMSNGQVLRANEFMSYQMQLMEMQKSWMRRPNADYATRQLLQAQDIYGNALDSRAIQNIGKIEDTISRPQEGYAKVMMYDIIQQLHPETRGNLRKIKEIQYSQDPKIREELRKAYYDRVIKTYGSANTTSGMLALGSLFGTDNPYEIDDMTKMATRRLPGVTKGNISNQTSALKYYTPEMSKEMMRYQDETIKEISEQLSGLEGVSRLMLNTFKEQLSEIIADLKK